MNNPRGRRPIDRVVPHDKKLAVFVRGRWQCLLRYWRSVLLLRADEPPEPVAMVLTVQGPLKLRRMDLLRPGDEVPVPPLGGVQILFLRDGHKETLKPGFTIRITDSGGAPAEAVQREKIVLPKTQLNGLRTLAVSARAAVARIRDVRAPPLPEGPINDATVLSDRPTFAGPRGKMRASTNCNFSPATRFARTSSYGLNACASRNSRFRRAVRASNAAKHTPGGFYLPGRTSSRRAD